LLPYRCVDHRLDPELPVWLYMVGYHPQQHLYRPQGFSSEQLFITRHGSGVFRFEDGQETTLEAGQSMYLKKDIPHEYYPLSAEPWELGYIGFQATVGIPQAFLLEPNVKLQLEEWDKVWSILQNIWFAAEEEGEHVPYECSAAIYQLLLEVRRQTRTARQENAFRSNVPLAQELLIKRVITFLGEYFTQPLSLKQLSSTFGYSPQHLNRLFRKEKGMTVHQYILDLQINHAAYLLREQPKWPVQEIAKRVGMEPAYFIKRFKQRFGTTPYRYKVLTVEEANTKI
jgi:AraC family transcriptional regulator